MKYIWFILLLLLPAIVEAQTNTVPSQKEITSYTQTWISINTAFRFSNRWGAVGDFHFRSDNFFKNDYFYFARVGGVYWVKDRYPIIAGIAHLWLAPAEGNNAWANENRIYQQWSAVTPQGGVSILHRIRLEQRWRDLVMKDRVEEKKQFSIRLRYLASFEVKLAQDPKKPKLIISDEILVQFGKTTVYNTFDQNRFFCGLKIPLSDKLSCDVGYMNILQQAQSGYQYDLSHVFRLFFYFNLDLAKGVSLSSIEDNAE